jgi:polysaccharide export outer membrane protein
MIAGMTAEEAQAAIEKKLVDGGFVNNPHVTVSVKEYTSEGITVLGEVARPGTYSALSSRRLYDAFMAAGGLTPRAGTTVAISHRNSGEAAQTVTLSNQPAKSAESNLELKPGDTVVVSRAGVVYVVGEVGRPGEFVIENPELMTVMRVIAMAAGPTRMANLSHAKMLRRSPDGLHNTEVNLKNIIEAKAPDVPLQAEDILFIPPSKSKAAAERGANSVLSMITSLALYRF